MVPDASPAIGLARSGGAARARGLVHIAVLEVLEEEGISFAAIAGTSYGMSTALSV